MEKVRRGFVTKEKSPDWSIDGDYLCWKNPSTHKMPISELRSYLFSGNLGDSGGASKYPIMPLIDKHLYKTPQTLTSAKRYELIQRVIVYDVKDFFKVASVVLTSRHWTDSEKLFLILLKLNQLSGFAFGKNLQSLLAQIHWSQSSAIDRITAFYKYCEQDDKMLSRAKGDANDFSNFSDPLVLYRGFNVPLNETIRGRNVRKSWFQQEAGKSVFFTTDESVAKWFACTQKARAVQRYDQGAKTTVDDRAIIGGRLCVATYQVPLSDILLYQHRIGRYEKEVLMLPFDAKLRSYRFLGFDDFVELLKTPPPMALFKRSIA